MARLAGAGPTRSAVGCPPLLCAKVNVVECCFPGIDGVVGACCVRGTGGVCCELKSAELNMILALSLAV